MHNYGSRNIKQNAPMKKIVKGGGVDNATTQRGKEGLVNGFRRGKQPVKPAAAETEKKES